MERFGLETENWIFPGFNDLAYSYGVRFSGQKMAIDPAFFDVLDGNATFPGLPFIDFVFNF